MEESKSKLIGVSVKESHLERFVILSGVESVDSVCLSWFAKFEFGVVQKSDFWRIDGLTASSGSVPCLSLAANPDAWEE